jgi:hypothetical protein
VAYICNPSYSGDRDQEDHGLKANPANSSWRSYLQKKKKKKKKKTIAKKKRAGGVAQGVGPEFKPQYRKKINK